MSTSDLRALPDGSLSRDEVAEIANQLDDLESIVNWFHTTHGSELGHDHHCPDSSLSADAGTNRCTCGWTAARRAFDRQDTA